MNQRIDTGREVQRTGFCNWHPSVETGLSCGKCGKGTCTRCLVNSSVGIRCPDCGKATKIPTFEVRPIAYAKAVLVGVVVVIGGGALWGVVNLILVNLGLVIFASAALPGLVIGYAVGELVDAAVNGRRSKGLAYITGGSVVGAFVFAQILYSGHMGFFGLIVLAVALYIAVQRVK